MDQSLLLEYKNFSISVAKKAGEIMLKYFDSSSLSQHEKSDLSIVTIADEEINNMVITEVAKQYPTHSVYGEEASSEKHTDNVWVCDPIDGTINYSKGTPVCVFSLAFVKDGQPLTGVVYDPFTKRMYSAIKGAGAFLNDLPLQTSSKDLSHKATLDFHWWPEVTYDLLPIIRDLSMETRIFCLSCGSAIAGACLVARGHYEAAIFPGTKGKNVDIAALKVIIEEAGGLVTDLFGNEQRYDQDINGALISNRLVHPQLISYLKKLQVKN